MTTAVATRPGRNGGRLLAGGQPGHVGAGGRPPSLIRQQLRGSFAERIQTLEQIADGRPIQKARFKPLDLIPYVVCANCGESEVKAKTPEDAVFAEIDVDVSATPKDRIQAIDLLAKYGLGTIKEVSVEQVRERVQQTLDVIQSQVSPEQYQAIVQGLQPIWA